MPAKRTLHPRLKRTAALGLVAAAALVLGCGKNRLHLDVDVLSFMNPADMTGDYLAPPLPPGTPPLATTLPPLAINLVEGYKDFGSAQEVGIDVALQCANATGQGRGNLAVYFGADAASTYSATPVASVDVDLQPGATSTNQVHLAADRRVLDLFTSKQMWMGVKFTWDPQSIDPLQGTYTITAIKAHVVSTLDVF